MSDAPKNRELLTLCLGSAGVKIGHRVWEQYNWEHGLLPNGTFNGGCIDSLSNTQDNIGSIYNEAASGYYSPRALFWDFDPSAIHDLFVGRYRKLYDPTFIVAGKEDAANNYARAYHTLGREFYEVALNKIRKLVEPCDNLQGFKIIRSLGGGTGSGIGSLLMEKLGIHYGKKLNVEFNVFPSRCHNSGVTDPYNVVLSQNTAMALDDIAFLFDNDALFRCCTEKLQIQEPFYAHANKLIAKVMAGITAPFRFTGQGSMSMNEFQTNLVPLPRLHFAIPAMAPIYPAETRECEKDRDISTMISDLFDRRNQMLSHSFDHQKPKSSKYIGLTMLFRGSSLSPNDVNLYTQSLQKRLPFVNFVQGGIKSSICSRPPFYVPGSDFAPSEFGITGLVNTTGLIQPWEKVVLNNYDKMWKVQAFLHWYYAEGMEKGDFEEARENMAGLMTEYRNVESDTEKEFKEKMKHLHRCVKHHRAFNMQPTVIGIKSKQDSTSSGTGSKILLSKSKSIGKLSATGLHKTSKSLIPINHHS